MNIIPHNTLAPKDPGDIKDYGIDYTLILAEEGDTTIVTSVWGTSNPAGLEILADPPPTSIVNGIKSVLWVEHGVVSDVEYRITNTVTTNGGRTHVKSIIIPCQYR
jgi:hypothetical protein